MMFVTGASVCLLCCIYLSYAADFTDLPYECKALGCKAGAGNTCPMAGGSCTCSPADNKDQRCMGLAASAAGTCTGCIVANTVGGTISSCNEQYPSKCLCKPGYTGSTCAEKRLTATCADDKVTIAIRPYGPINKEGFDGVIYVNPTATFDQLDNIDASCKSTAATTDYTRDVLWAATPNPTGQQCKHVNAIDMLSDQSGHMVYIYIQHHPLFRSDADQVIGVKCSVSGRLEYSNTFDVQSANTVSQSNPLKRVVYTDPPSGMAMAAKQGSSDVTGNVAVGDAIDIILSHTAKFTIENCIAGDSAALDGNTAPLILDWCVDPRAFGLFTGAFGYAKTAADCTSLGCEAAKTHGIKFTIKAFYFSGSSTNNLVIKCAACTTCTGTGLATCQNSLTSFGEQETALTARRRRSAGSEEGAITNMTITISLRRPGERIQVDVGSNDESVEVVDCYKSTSVLLPVILLAVLLLVTMVMTFFFCMKLTHSQGQPRLGHDNISYKS